jgi:flagellar hook-length control protein FliK
VAAMSSSSAYSNVLLKSPVQPQAAAVPRRDYQDDQSSESFQQSLQDAHDRVRTQDDHAAKAAPKKATQTSVNSAEKQARQTDKDDARDGASATEKSSDSNQNTDGKSLIDKNADSKATIKKTGTDEDKPTDASAQTTLVTNTNAPAPVTPTGIALPSMAVTTESKTEADSTLESTEAGVVVANAKTGTSIKGDAKNSLVTLAGNDQAAAEKSGSIKATTDAGTDLSLVNAQVTAATAQAQSQPAANIDVTEQQAPSTLMASVGSTVLPKTASTQSALAPAVDDSAEADSLNLLANSSSGEKTSAKIAVLNDPKMATADATSTQPQILDSKSTFEKTLQNLIHPESRDETTGLQAAPETGSSTSSTPSSTNTLDSLSRFNDTQTPAARSFVVQTAVPVPVGQPQWSQAVGEKVLWLAAQNVSSAEIHLNPENLGPVQVKVSVNQDQTTVNFTSHHAVVREVLDQNMGRLRDMFSEQGLNLVNVDVSDKSFSRQQGDAKDQKGQANTNDINIEEEPTPVAMTAIVQQRLVDHYA